MGLGCWYATVYRLRAPYISYISCGSHVHAIWACRDFIISCNTKWLPEIRCSKWFPEAHICWKDYKVILGIGCAIYIIYIYGLLNWQWRHLVTRFGQEERNVGGDKIAQRALILHTLYQNIYHCVSKACLLLPSPSPVWIRLQLEWQLGAKCGCELTLNRAGDIILHDLPV